MTEPNDNIAVLEKSRKLAEAIRDVKNANADRDDVVIEMREAERMRLELLASELAPIIAEVPDDTDLFDFAISSGLQPRFWIDAVAHVSMGRDKRTFRFLKDTRLGRVVLAESTDMKPVANQVTRYLAERIVERQRLMEGAVVEHGKRRAIEVASTSTPSREQALYESAAASSITEPVTTVETERRTKARTALKTFITGLLLAIAGAAVGLAATALLYWERLGIAEMFKG